MKSGVLLTVMITAAMIFPVCAQPGDPGRDPGKRKPVPIAGVEILLSAGGLLGLYKIISNQKHKPDIKKKPIN